MKQLLSLPVCVCLLLFLLLDIVILLSIKLTIVVTICFVLQILSSLVGAVFLSRYRLRVLFEILIEYQNGNIIVEEMWIAGISSIASVCLLFPGVLTDLIGVFWFTPLGRKYILYLLETFFY